MWNKVYKWTLSISIAAVVGVFLFLGVKLYLDTADNKAPSEKQLDDPEQVEDSPIENEKQVIELSQEKKKENKDADYVNPFGDTDTTGETDEKTVMKYMNYMAHQKVVAGDKWGFYQITSERIQFLIDTLEQNEFQHEEVYRAILTRWKDGDFSQAVEDHNKIWRLQNGNVGKATRLYTEEEEQAFLEKYTK